MKKYRKRFLAMFLTLAMVFTLLPATGVNATGEGETATGTTQTIKCTKFVQAGANGDQVGTDGKKAAIIGVNNSTGNGDEKSAARVEGETAIGSTEVGSSRVAAMGFQLPGKKTSDDQAGIDPELISRAEVTITIWDGNENLGGDKKTKAAIFQVDSAKYEGMKLEILMLFIVCRQ